MNLAYALIVGFPPYFSKSSLLLLYQEYFSVKRSMRIAVYIRLIATFLTYFPSISVSIRLQSPQRGESWEDLLVSDDPPKAIYWGIVHGALVVALDIYIFVLPLPTLATLNMSVKQ
jgi:hypothetical protein